MLELYTVKRTVTATVAAPHLDPRAPGNAEGGAGVVQQLEPLQAGRGKDHDVLTAIVSLVGLLQCCQFIEGSETVAAGVQEESQRGGGADGGAVPGQKLVRRAWGGR